MSLRSLFRNVVCGASACCLIFGLGFGSSATAQSVIDPFLEGTSLEGTGEPGLRALVDETMLRNPGLAAATARARAAGHRAPQVGALPDPTVGVTAFVNPPETRVGPQQLTLTASQQLPWRSKLRTRAAAADLRASALAAEADFLRLTLLTELRIHLLDLGLVDRLTQINQSIRAHLLHHEHTVRTRYATGSGPGQGVIKLQAAITTVDHRLLELDARQLELQAEINVLRDRPPGTPLPAAESAMPEPPALDVDELIALALAARPDLRAAQRRIERAKSLEQLANIERRPDFEVGLTYTLVDTRDDEPGLLQPPPGNGKDILGLRADVSIPLWRRKLAAGVDEAVESSRRSVEEQRMIKARLERDVSELVGLLPIRWRQLRLIRDVLVVQAKEAVDSATSGYLAGALSALDLLDAAHVLFEAQTAVARAETDYLTARTRLEGAIGVPLSEIARQETAQ